jgi:hypothetical protein
MSDCGQTDYALNSGYGLIQEINFVPIMSIILPESEINAAIRGIKNVTQAKDSRYRLSH